MHRKVAAALVAAFALAGVAGCGGSEETLTSAELVRQVERGLQKSAETWSSARRYLARIFVAASTSVMSIRLRMRASRSWSPISGISVPGYVKPSSSSGTATVSPRSSSAASTRGTSASATSTWRGLEPS